MTLEHCSKHPYGSLIKLSIASIILASVFMNIFALTSAESVPKPSNKASTPYDSLSTSNIPLCDLFSLTPGCLIGLVFTTESTRVPPTLSSTLSESPVVILNICTFDSTGLISSPLNVNVALLMLLADTMLTGIRYESPFCRYGGRLKAIL